MKEPHIPEFVSLCMKETSRTYLVYITRTHSGNLPSLWEGRQGRWAHAALPAGMTYAAGYTRYTPMLGVPDMV